jgi:hypothetical protein
MMIFNVPWVVAQLYSAVYSDTCNENTNPNFKKWETGRKKRHTVGLCRPLGIRWLGGGCDWIEEQCGQPAQEEVPGFPSLLWRAAHQESAKSPTIADYVDSSSTTTEQNLKTDSKLT